MDTSTSSTSKTNQNIPVDPRQHTDRILELIKEIGSQERHFNQSIDKYKTMASTWLLAVFGAIGFVLANQIEPWLLYAAGIGFAGGIGILLLWIIDIRVYQQLLASAFIEGMRLEGENEWLPKVRHNMAKSQKTGSVTANLSWFYVLGVSAPLLIFNFSLGSYLLINYGFIFSVSFIVISGGLVFWMAYSIRFTSKEESLQKDYVNLNQKLDARDLRLMIFIGCPLYILFFVLIYVGTSPDRGTSVLQTVMLKKMRDHVAPDGSEIREFFTTAHGSAAHCTLPPAAISKAMQHKTVEEIWYVLEGQGEIWRKNTQDEDITKLVPGTCISIPEHTRFQFRNTGQDSLKILLLTMPPSPGKNEAFDVGYHWVTR